MDRSINIIQRNFFEMFQKNFPGLQHNFFFLLCEMSFIFNIIPTPTQSSFCSPIGVGGTIILVWAPSLCMTGHSTGPLPLTLVKQDYHQLWQGTNLSVLGVKETKQFMKWHRTCKPLIVWLFYMKICGSFIPRPLFVTLINLILMQNRLMEFPILECDPSQTTKYVRA